MQISDLSRYVRVPLFIDEATARREVILAAATPRENVFVAKNIPAFVYGLALGDHFRSVRPEHGDFEVVERSGHVTIRAYVDGTLDRPEVTKLVDEITKLGGKFEIARNSVEYRAASLLLLSLHVRHGFPKIESLLTNLPAEGCSWEYGNVYNETGALLNWWPAN